VFDAVGGYDERVFYAEEIVLSRAVKMKGPFVIVREAVSTSSRKYDEISMWQFLRQVGPMIASPSRLERRHDWWYGRQRDESKRRRS
jgi:hypothetical protein